MDKQSKKTTNLNIIDNIRLGSHVSISGGIYKAFERGTYLNCNTVQIFTRNNTQWYSKPINEDDLKKYKEYEKNSNISPVVSHASYLINLAARDEDILRKSIISFQEEILRCIKLNIKILVIHPGSHGGLGIKEGILKIIKSINQSYRNLSYPDVVLTLETTAGQGNSIGSTFTE
jgi:deoxyribonuclease-4